MPAMTGRSLAHPAALARRHPPSKPQRHHSDPKDLSARALQEAANAGSVIVPRVATKTEKTEAAETAKAA